MSSIPLHFTPLDQAPREPQAVRVVDLRADPQPDGRRVRVTVRLTPFTTRPDVELTLYDPQGRAVGSLSLVQVMHTQVSITVHARRPLPAEAPCKVVAEVRYPDPAQAAVSAEGLPSRVVVHRAEAAFRWSAAPVS